MTELTEAIVKQHTLLEDDEPGIEIAILKYQGFGGGLELFIKMTNGKTYTKQLSILTITMWVELATQAIGEHLRKRWGCVS